jgi:hypothetical protein
MTGRIERRPTAVHAMIAAVPPLLSPTFTAVLPLLIDNSKSEFKILKCNQNLSCNRLHNSGEK